MPALHHITGTAHIWVRFAQNSDDGSVDVKHATVNPVRSLRALPEPITENALSTLQDQNNLLGSNSGLFQPSPDDLNSNAVGFGTGFNSIGLIGGAGVAVATSTTGLAPIPPSGIIAGPIAAFAPTKPVNMLDINLGSSIASSIGDGKNVLYLGTAETAPRIQTTDYTRPIFTDEGGTIVPTELAYQSRRAVIIVDLNRFDYNTYLRMENAPRHLANQKRNADSRLDIGRLMTKYMFELWIKFSYYNTDNATGTNLPPGYYFPRCWLEGPTTDEVGARVQRVRVIWSAYRLHSNHSWLLYSQNPEDFTGVPDNEP